MAKAKKTTPKKTAAKKSVAKKSVAKKVVAKKAVAKKAVAKKAVAKKAVTKKVATKKTSTEKTVVKKAVVKKAVPAKTVVKKGTVKKSVAKKTPTQASTTTATAAKKTAKKTKSAPKKALVSRYADDAPAPQRVNKASPFGALELREWQSLLVRRRMEVSGDIKDLVRDAMDSEDGHTMPTHQADRGSDVDLQDLSLGMLGDEETLLWQIDRALRKIDNGFPIAFGLCEHNHKAVPIARLEMLPWTPISIEGAEYMEENGLTLHDMIIDD